LPGWVIFLQLARRGKTALYRRIMAKDAHALFLYSLFWLYGDGGRAEGDDSRKNEGLF
jgi:hypothetical protein